jgi:hypothetical protein
VSTKADLNSKYCPSEEIVAREIEGELIIVPIVSGIGDMEDELFSLNDTGRAVWDKLDGETRLKDVVGELSQEFEALDSRIERDVLGLVEELLKRRMLLEVPELQE